MSLREELDEYITQCNASDEFEFVRTEEVIKIIEKRIDEIFTKPRKFTITQDEIRVAEFIQKEIKEMLK